MFTKIGKRLSGSLFWKGKDEKTTSFVVENVEEERQKNNKTVPSFVKENLAEDRIDLRNVD